MAQNARLITPRGKRIDLSPEMYRQVRRILKLKPKRRQPRKLDRAIASTYGKYAGGRSLTRALLTERAAERAREDRRAGHSRG